VYLSLFYFNSAYVQTISSIAIEDGTPKFIKIGGEYITCKGGDESPRAEGTEI
jgi:hypothetical protein